MPSLWLLSRDFVMAEHRINLLQGEIVELHDLGFGPQGGRQNRTSFFLAVNFRNDPGFVLPVHAPPVRMGQEMGAGLEKDFHDPSFRFTRTF
jgi:hypothetical protein